MSYVLKKKTICKKLGGGNEPGKVKASEIGQDGTTTNLKLFHWKLEK